MSAIQQLITEHMDIWTAADTGKRSGRGRASSNAGSVYGVKKLRELILELAVRGKLVPQDANDEPASELLKHIQAKKAKLVAEGKIKKDKPLVPITDDEKSFELPTGWEWVRLGDIIDYVNGYAFSSKDFATQGVGVVKIGDIQQGKVASEFMSRVSEDVVDGLDTRLQVINGDLVIAMSGATTGKLGFNETEEVFYLNQRVGKIVPFIISKKFLYLDLTTKIADNLKISFGSAIPNLSTEQINSIVTAIPSLAEQHRIVAKVDELMALCDQLEAQHSNAAEAHEKLVSHLLGTLTQSQSTDDFNANWQRIAAHFDTLFTTETSIDALKQTLLQLAVMGKLVLQDANDEPASELLKRIQAEKAKLVAEGKIKKDKPLAAIGDDEKPFELPHGWEWARFPELGEFGRGKSKHRPRNDPKLFNPGIYPLVQTGEVARADNIIGEYHSKYSDIGLAQSKMWPAGTLCITIAANIADSALLGFDACFPDSVVGFVPYEPLRDTKYLLSFMKTAREDLLKFAPATAQKNINLEILESVLIPLPPLKEITRIVAKVDALMALCDQLKTRITAANQQQQKLADVLVEHATAQ